MAVGICKLTGERGIFIKSHLIPKALTRPAIQGAPLIEIDSGRHPIRRWDSWYDTRLVTRKGEDLLTDLDTTAIQELRRLRLIWSGWENTGIEDFHTPIKGTPFGIRKIQDADSKSLRLFFLSLLWRAGASERREFAGVKLQVEHLEVLRTMVVEKNEQPIDFFNIQLTQLSTRGVIHNQTPFGDVKRIPNLERPGDFDVVPIFRFYFDGLIVHFHPPIESLSRDPSTLILGSSDVLTVSTVTYEDSFQRRNLHTVMTDSLPPKRKGSAAVTDCQAPEAHSQR